MCRWLWNCVRSHKPNNCEGTTMEIRHFITVSSLQLNLFYDLMGKIFLCDFICMPPPPLLCVKKLQLVLVSTWDRSSVAPWIASKANMMQLLVFPSCDLSPVARSGWYWRNQYRLHFSYYSLSSIIRVDATDKLYIGKISLTSRLSVSGATSTAIDWEF